MMDLQHAVDALRESLGAAQAVLVVRDPVGFNALAVSGVGSHQDAILLLASASHMVLISHDAAVRDGAAGEDATRVAELADLANEAARD